MQTTQIKIFISGAVLGAILGAAFLAPIFHVLLIGAVLLTVGAVLHRGRRAVLGRNRDDGRLEP